MTDQKAMLVLTMAWYKMPRLGGPHPPKSTCLYSNGISFWTGWYDSDTKSIVLTGPAPLNRRIKLEQVSYWAKLDNLMQWGDQFE